MISNPSPQDSVVYPDSDGKPMAENTLQYEWIVTVQGNLDLLFQDRADVFVAGDNFIYAKQGHPKISTAPDVYVAFGRPKGYRGSYKVWVEDNIFPQVIFEVLSPGNSAKEMKAKRNFYQKYGAEEYYVIDPDRGTVIGYIRTKNKLVEIPENLLQHFLSPRLGIRFEMSGEKLTILGPTGERFLSFLELGKLAESEKKRAYSQQRRADTQKRRADHAEVRAEAAEARLVELLTKEREVAARQAKLAEKLRELGMDPDEV